MLGTVRYLLQSDANVISNRRKIVSLSFLGNFSFWIIVCALTKLHANYANLNVVVELVWVILLCDLMLENCIDSGFIKDMSLNGVLLVKKHRWDLSLDNFEFPYFELNAKILLDLDFSEILADMNQIC